MRPPASQKTSRGECPLFAADFAGIEPAATLSKLKREFFKCTTFTAGVGTPPERPFLQGVEYAKYRKFRLYVITGNFGPAQAPLKTLLLSLDSNQLDLNQIVTLHLVRKPRPTLNQAQRIPTLSPKSTNISSRETLM